MKQIPIEIKAKWDSLRGHGDNLAIKRMTKISHVTIDKALNDGLATMKTIKAINKYYKKKEEEIERMRKGELI